MAIPTELQSLELQAIDTADVRRLHAGFDELWRTIQPREQVRLTSLPAKPILATRGVCGGTFGSLPNVPNNRPRLPTIALMDVTRAWFDGQTKSSATQTISHQRPSHAHDHSPNEPR